MATKMGRFEPVKDIDNEEQPRCSRRDSNVVCDVDASSTLDRLPMNRWRFALVLLMVFSCPSVGISLFLLFQRMAAVDEERFLAMYAKLNDLEAQLAASTDAQAVVMSATLNDLEAQLAASTDAQAVVIGSLGSQLQSIAVQLDQDRIVKHNGKLDAMMWFKDFQLQTPYRKYSQGYQDGVLRSLFAHIGVTNKYFVEFGFNQDGFVWRAAALYAQTGPNTQLLREEGWTGLLLDGGHENLSDNLHKEFITPENIVSLLDKYQVPAEPDFVSIDIDSCDLWVLLSILKGYKPRVISVEYQAYWPLESSVTNVCRTANESYHWTGDLLWSASLAAFHKAAAQNGYALLWADVALDVFLVRQDLLHPGSEPPLEAFKDKTGLNKWNRKIPSKAQIAKWIEAY